MFQNSSSYKKKNFSIHAKQQVDEFIKEKIEDWDALTILSEMNEEHEIIDGDFMTLLMSVI